MLGLRKILGTIILVIAFLVLAGLASVFYNSDQTQKDKVVNSSIFQQGSALFQTLLGTSESIANVNLQKNMGLGKTVADTASKVDWISLLQGDATSTTDTKILTANNEDNADVTGAVSYQGNYTDMSDIKDVINGSGASEIAAIPGDTNNNKASTTSFWANFVSSLKEEWEANQQPDPTPSKTISKTTAKTNGQNTKNIKSSSTEINLLDYNKTTNGAEIIYKTKNGEQYKLPLPFKFLSRP